MVMLQSTTREHYLPKMYNHLYGKDKTMKTNEKIRQLREARQWTQEEMANKLAMSTQGYAKIERGDTRSNLDRLEQISEVFGIDIVELLSFGENRQINFSNSNNESSFNNAFFGGSLNNVELEIQRLQLIISHKDETIEALKRENQLLTEMNAILKNK